MLEEKYKEYIEEVCEELVDNIKFESAYDVENNKTKFTFTTCASELDDYRNIYIDLEYYGESFKLEDISFKPINLLYRFTIDKKTVKIGHEFLKKNIDKVVNHADYSQSIQAGFVRKIHTLISEDPLSLGYRRLTRISDEDKIKFNSFIKDGSFVKIDMLSIRMDKETPYLKLKTDDDYIIFIGGSAIGKSYLFRKPFMVSDWRAFDVNIHELEIKCTNPKSDLVTGMSIPVTIYKRIENNDSTSNDATNPFTMSNSF